MKKYNYIRYCDDIFVLSSSIYQLNIISKEISEILLNDYKLSINKNKTEIIDVYKTQYLGYRLCNYNNNIEVITKKRKNENFVNTWNKTELSGRDRKYYLLSDGILSQKDFSVYFENESGKFYLPIENIETLNIYSNVILNSNILKIINSKKIVLNIFDRYNRFIGKFIPSTIDKSSLLLLKQVSAYNDRNERIYITKTILGCALFNIISNLKYYDRRYDINLVDKINEIQKLNQKIKKENKYENILLLEAKARQIYYSCFNAILNDKYFEFTCRTKRPPKDPINSLISFGNTVLYNYIASEIYKTNLDIRIGYLHASNNRRESLNLDISEVFKPIIIDRIIFKLINKKMINRSHFEDNNNGIYLNNDGKKIFINEFYVKINSFISVKDGKINYGKIIKKDIYKFINYLQDKDKFKPFKYY